MKRLLSLLLAALLLTGAAATAEDAVRPLEGVVTVVDDEGFLMEDIVDGSYRVVFDADTTFEGVIDHDNIAEGQYVFVQYDGTSTRSLPPQVTADTVSCFAVSGTVSELLADGFLLTGDPVLGDVLVNADKSLATVFAGQPATVYFDGVMATSLPGQIGALKIDVPTLSGTVSASQADGFLLTDQEGTPYQINLTDASLTDAAIADGDTVRVLYNGQLTRSIPAQAHALLVAHAD